MEFEIQIITIFYNKDLELFYIKVHRHLFETYTGLFFRERGRMVPGTSAWENLWPNALSVTTND